MTTANDELQEPELTPIERHYLAQGYVLPPPLTWAMVHERRQRYPEVRSIDVPLELAAGCCAWGVPFINGKPLEWRSIVSEAELCGGTERFDAKPRRLIPENEGARAPACGEPVSARRGAKDSSR